MNKPARIDTKSITLFLCGDVMSGRGIDQILPHPVSPELYEPYMTSALGYVELAEMKHGPIPSPVAYTYVWGDALIELESTAPDARIVNLETAVTTSTAYWPGKGIHYRMHPQNVPCLKAAGIDCCVLANNHVLDWGYRGLEETLEALGKAGVGTAGAGRSREEAEAPALIEVAGKGRVWVFAYGCESSGIPPDWAAGRQPGVNLLENLSAESLERVAGDIRRWKAPGDLAVVSLHWGDNWGYQIAEEEQDFARGLVEEAGVDVVHGHSSHHPKALEVHRSKLLLYGCGDFLNDYEGIGGYERFRGDLNLMYFVTLDAASGALLSLEMVPLQVRRFRLNRAVEDDALWLKRTLERECRKFGARIESSRAHRFSLSWG